MNRCGAFGLILLGFAIIGPAIGGVLFWLGVAILHLLDMDRDGAITALQLLPLVLAVSYIPGLLPAVAAGFYLARRALFGRPFVRRSYYLTAVITSMLAPGYFLLTSTSESVGDIGYVMTFLAPPVMLAALSADICLRIMRRILRNTPYALTINPRRIPSREA